MHETLMFYSIDFQLYYNEDFEILVAKTFTFSFSIKGLLQIIHA